MAARQARERETETAHGTVAREGFYRERRAAWRKPTRTRKKGRNEGPIDVQNNYERPDYRPGTGAVSR